MRSAICRPLSRSLAIFLGVMTAALLVAFANRAGAVDRTAGACGKALGPWISACERAEDLSITAEECPPGRVILVASGATEEVLRVEFSVATPKSFRRVGDVGISPIGEFDDWSKVSKERQRTLEKLTACVERDAGLPIVVAPAGPQSLPGAGSRAHGLVAPWLLLAAGLLAAVACALQSRRSECTKARWRSAIALLVLTVGTFSLRFVLVPAGFFHQNGQGPLWIDLALHDNLGLSRYGPGYSEVFGWSTHWTLQNPEAAVLMVQGAFAALNPLLGFVVARSVGAGRVISWTVAGVLVIDPLLARMARSESYFGIGVSLLFLASAALARGTLGAKTRSVRFAMWIAVAGLLIAEAARVHPVTWVPSSLIPLVLLVQTGRLRRRALRTAIGALGIGAVVAIVTGGQIVGVVRGSLGAQWVPQSSFAPTIPIWGWVALTLLTGLLFALSRRRVSDLAPGLVFILCVLVADGSNLLKHTVPWIWESHWRLFLPVLVGALAGGLGRIVEGRNTQAIAAIVLALAAIVYGVARWTALTQNPTDTMEARLFTEWRKDLPAGAVVVYLSHAGKRSFVLPLYDGSRQTPHPVDAAGRPPDPSALGDLVYYYRSSLCVSAEGASTCQDLERRLRLTPIHEQHLLPVPSMPELPLGTDPIRVGLYRHQ